MSSSGNITGTVFQLLGISGTTSVAPGSPDILPPTIELAEGTVLRGVANGRTPEGATLIRTEIGDLSLNTDIFLKRGVEVAVQIERRQQDAFVRLVSIDGKSVPKYLEQQAAQATPTADTIETSSLSSTAKPSVPPSSAVLTPDSVIPARVEAVLLSRPTGSPLSAQAAPITPASSSGSPASTLQGALVQSGPGSRVTLDVLGITFPKAVAAAPVVPASSAMPSSSSQPAMPAASEATNPVAPLPPALAAYQRAALSSGPAPLPTATPGLPLTPASSSAPSLPPTVLTNLPPAPSTGTPLTPMTASPAAIPPVATPSAASPAPAISVPAPQVQTAPPLSAPATVANQLMPTTSAPEAGRPALPPLPGLASSPVAHSAPPLPGPPVFSAMVLGDSGPGELILQTPVGTLKLLNTPALPAGSQLQVRINDIVPPSELPGEDSLATLPLPGSKPSRWEALEAFAALAAAQPRLAGASHLPSAGKHTLTDVLFLLAALKGGDLRRFIGEARAKEMETAAPDLLARLGAEFTSLRGMAIESPDPQGWNLHTLPFLSGGQLEPVRLYHKRSRKEDGRSQAGDTDHFIVDMILSGFGPFQLDGLVKRQTPLQFDLTVRTERPLADAVERDIRFIYQDAASLSGYQGSLLFRHGPKACVPPPVTYSSGSAADHSILV